MITFATASAPAVLDSSPQKEIVSALNKVRASAGITPYGDQQQVELGAASESSDTSENLVAVWSFFAFGELGFLPEEVYFLTGKIADGAGSIYIYQFSSEGEALTALQRRQQMIVELNKRDYGEVVAKEKTQKESDTVLREIWNYTLENFRFSLEKGEFHGQPAYFYSGHATGDLAQFNPGYIHEIGWVQGKFAITTATTFAPSASISPLKEVAELVYAELAPPGVPLSAEDEKKIKDLVREFVDSMPMTATAKKKVLSALDSFRFPEGCRYKNASQCLHEIGHFLHYTIADADPYFRNCHNPKVGDDDTTWAPPAPTAPLDLVSEGTQRAITSFAESSADFFALLAMNFWENQHPESEQSGFFQRGYLEEFESEAKALTAAGKYPGCQVEGVQARFLRAYYGSQCRTSPAEVYADFLETMLLYKENPENRECWFQRVPARTIGQWVFAKSNHPSAFGESGVDHIASKYQVLSGTGPVATAAPSGKEKSAVITVGKHQVSFDEFPVAEIRFGEEVTVLKGRASINLSTAEEQKAVYLCEGAIAKVHNSSLVEVKQGAVGVEGEVVLQTPSCTIEPTGTAVYAEVADDGTVRIRNLAGRALISSSKGKTKLEPGEEVTVSTSGSCSGVTSFDLEAFRRSKFPPEEFPFKPFTGLWVVNLVWILLLATGTLIPLALVILLIYGIRQKKSKT